MDAHERYQNILDNILLKNGVVTLTGTKDDLGCHLITFQSRQQMLFTQIDYSRLIESIYAIIMYYKSPLVSLLVDMSHSNQVFIDHFIHVVDQLERKMSKSEIKRVYIVRPERKSFQKHLSKELGSKSKDGTRITAQIVILKTFEELHQHIKRNNLTNDFGGALEHDYRAWLAAQKILIEYYNLVNNVGKSSGDVLQRLRDLTSGKLGSSTPEKDTQHARKKRFRNLEKKRDTLLSQFNFTKVAEDSQRLRSYFEDPKLNRDFQALSKSPVFEMDKARFQQYYQKVLTLKDNIEHVWTDGVVNMKSLATEQELYDRLIECCTWILEEGLPYLTSLPGQSKTLAEAVKQKITSENEFFKPMKVILKKSRQTLKSVRHYQRPSDTSGGGGLDLMADNLTSLVENVKTKADERMEYLKKQKDFMQSLAKAESWCERASDLWPANQIPRTASENRPPPMLSDSKVEHFLKKHPPLTVKELGEILDYVDIIDDFELRTRARLLGNRCQELEKILRARETQRVDVSGEELSSEDHESLYGQDNPRPLRSTISSDVSNKRWHDDAMSSTTISNDDIASSGPRTSTGDENSRLADIQRRLRDQELLYEQLILEEELRELSERKYERGAINRSLDGTFERQKNTDISHETFESRQNTSVPGSSGRRFRKGSQGRQNREEKIPEPLEIGLNLDSRNPSGVGSGSFRKKYESVGKAEHDKKARNEGSPWANLSNLNSPGTSTKARVKRDGRRQQNRVELRNERLRTMSSLDGNGDAKDMKNVVNFSRSDGVGSIDYRNTSNKISQPGGTEHRSKRNLPSHIDLLDGCSSLKRLCNLGSTSQQSNKVPDFRTYYNQASRVVDSSISTKTPANPLSTSNDVSVLSNLLPLEKGSSDFENHAKDFESNSSRAPKEDLHVFGSIAKSHENSSPELLIGASSETVEMTRDSVSRSHDLESISRDPESGPRDTGDQSREELLEETRDTVNRWTQVKNEQRARLAQAIDDVSKRKEIEETYFNAQIQLCRARRNLANLSKSDLELSLNSDVTNCSLTPSFNTSLRLGIGGEQVVSGEGAFRKYVKEESSVAQNSMSNKVCPSEDEKGTMLDGEGSLGMNEVNDGINGEVVLDNGGSLGATIDIEHDIDESFRSGDLGKIQTEKSVSPSDDRVILEVNGDELDSEQGSSDEFDDVEEEELMLLCSHSSSDLLSQDELKNSLQGEQARLEETFRQQKEQLRMEREKLMEEKKRNDEWQKSKNSGNANVEGSNEALQLVDNANGVLEKDGDVGKISQSHVVEHLQHETQPLQHEMPQLSHVTNESQQKIPALPSNLLISDHDISNTENDNPAPQHETRFPQHVIPPPRNERTSSENEQNKQQRGKFPQDEKEPEHTMSEMKPQNIHDTISYFEALKQNYAPPKQTKFADRNVKETKQSPKKTTDDSVNVESDVNDLSEIVFSNFDSDDESRKEIEEELINILHDKTLAIDGRKSEEHGQESVPSLPPLQMSCNPPSMVDNNDDIELMNQLIDDLMITDHNSSNHGDYDEFSLGKTQPITDGDHWVNVDAIESGDDGSSSGGNLGVDVDKVAMNSHDDGIDNVDTRIDMDSDGVNEDKSELSEGSIGLDVDNEINLDDLRINEVDIGVSNVVKIDDNPEPHVKNYMMNQDTGDHAKGDEGARNEELGLDVDFPIDLNEDSGAIDSSDLIALLSNRTIISGHNKVTTDDDDDDEDEEFDVDVDFPKELNKGDKEVQTNDVIGLLSNHKTTSGDEKMLSESKRPRNEKFDVDVDFPIELNKDDEEVQTNDVIGLLSNHETTSGDEMLSEKASPRIGLDLDVEFTIDLDKHGEEVQGNDLIDLLRDQSGAFSSQESLVDDDDGHVAEANFVTPNTSQPDRGQERLDGETTSENNHFHEDADYNENINGLSKSEITVDINKEHSGITGQAHNNNGVAKSSDGISEGHHVMSEDSDDDDFGRVLEDIQEEESEYEDLMGYKGAQVDNNDNLTQERAEIIAPITRAVRSYSQMSNGENMSASFTSSIIIDPGTGYCKAGFSIDDQPRVSIPSIVGMPKSQLVASGRYKEHYIGEEAIRLHQALDLHRPLKNGLVQDWDLMEKLLDEVYEELRCESDQYPVLFSEPVLNPKSNREEMIQMMFETFHVPAAYSCAQAVLSLFATGRTTGLVYDCGYSKAHSVPVYEGYALPRGTTTVALAGRELTTCLARMLRDRGVTMETKTEMDIVQDIKEKLCYVVVDYDIERKAYNIGQRNDTTYTMPDGQTVAIGSERFRCPEVLFTPSMVGMTTDGVHEALYKTTMQCAIDIRKSLFQNIVISGGSTMFPGFSRRLHVELCKLLGTRTPDSVTIDAVDDRNTLTWQGGAMLSKLSNFQSMWITTAEYNECGPGIVHKKCV